MLRRSWDDIFHWVCLRAANYLPVSGLKSSSVYLHQLDDQVSILHKRRVSSYCCPNCEQLFDVDLTLWLNSDMPAISVNACDAIESIAATDSVGMSGFGPSSETSSETVSCCAFTTAPQKTLVSSKFPLTVFDYPV